jgi:hydroxymethyl cephem carbamoyltransferase
MLIVALKPSHDGAVAAIGDRKLLFSLEAEKDSYPRYSALEPTTILNLAKHVDQAPDVIALSGWGKGPPLHSSIGAGYVGIEEGRVLPAKFFGHNARMFSSSHERSHIMMAVGMAPRNDSPRHAVLVWEGTLGHFYVLDERWSVKQRIPVMWEPGNRFAFLYALADPTFPDGTMLPRSEDAGKLMALAAYGNSDDASPAVAKTVDRILEAWTVYPAPKGDYRDSPLYNAEVESEETKVAAALMSRRIFETFASAAQEQLPEGLPLYISGGCGLNCDWNAQWRELGHFSSVFVPPCANDSGSAIGTAIDALVTVTGDPFIEWDVYSGLEFEWDCAPDARVWERQDLQKDAVAEVLAGGRIVAWVQGRWEIGPRALGNRSLLAEPFDVRTRDRLNEIKQREGYRPIAPCCRLEDADKLFSDGAVDPYMLYFRHVRSGDLGAVTHVDGSARVQTVTKTSNAPLHDLLSAFAERNGAGILCNTSLNFKGLGFINRMSDLVNYCEARGILDFVVSDVWFQRAEGSYWIVGPSLVKASRHRLLPPASVERLRSFLQSQGNLMDATIVSVLAYAGLRPRELLSLKWVDVGKRALRVSGAKEVGRTRRVGLLGPLAEDLALWRQACEEAGEEALVFPNSAGIRWSPDEWAAWRKEVFVPASRSCGMDVVHPAVLRNTFACLLLLEGMTSRKLAQQMGATPKEIRTTYELLRASLVAERDAAISAEEEIRRARDELPEQNWP